MKFGEQVKAARLARGWTQAKLARLVGCSVPTISTIERGGSEGGRVGAALRRALDLPGSKGDYIPRPRPATVPIEPVKGMAYPIPLRPDFTAQVVVPRDLTASEAQRIADMVLTVAVDVTTTVIDSILGTCE